MSRPHYEFAGNIWEQSDRCELCRKREVVKIHQLSESCITCNLAAHAFNIDFQSKEISKYRWLIPGLVTATGRLSGDGSMMAGTEDIPSLKLPFGHFVPTNSSDSACFELIQRWLSDCNANHISCSDSQTSQSEVPARPLDIGALKKYGSLRVVEQFDTSEPYIALSYCWGSGGTNATQSANYKERLQSIDISSLTKTYQDAIHLCTRLKVRYLWIDALCIIQDDPHDRAQEIAKMAYIYENAYLVVTVGLSASPSEGIYSNRTGTRKFTLRFNNLSYDIMTKDPCPAGGKEFRTTILTYAENPLSARAWAVQERLLGRRVVHYTKDELVWECRECSRCECLTTPFVDFAYKRDFHRAVVGAGFTEPSMSALESTLEVWDHVVMYFAGSKLFYASDRLVAIAGVARHFSNPSLGQYLAGLWEASLPQSLMWNRNSPVWRESLFRPKNNTTPTWSWASIETFKGISFERMSLGPIDNNLVVGECGVTAKDANNLYGDVINGYITLTGYTSFVNREWWYKLGHKFDLPNDLLNAISVGDGKHEMSIIVSQGILALRMAKMKTIEGLQYYLLMMASKRVEGAYERIGFGLMYDTYLLPDGQIRTLKLV